MCFCTGPILEEKGFSLPCQCISDGLKSCRALVVPTRINLTLLLCKQPVVVRNCHVIFQTSYPCFRPSFWFFFPTSSEKSTALSHFAAGWVTEGFFSPFLKRSLQLAAAGGQEDDVPSRAAREGSSEGIHLHCLQHRNHFRPSYRTVARVAVLGIPQGHCHSKQYPFCDHIPRPTRQYTKR